MMLFAVFVFSSCFSSSSFLRRKIEEEKNIEKANTTTSKFSWAIGQSGLQSLLFLKKFVVKVVVQLNFQKTQQPDIASV